MPKPRAAKLETATARRRLEVRKKPFWTTISPGIGLGYRRNAGPGTWSVRSTNSDGADWIKRIGLADDLEPADGKHVSDLLAGDRCGAGRWRAVSPAPMTRTARSRSAKRLTATSATSKAAVPMRRTPIACAGI